MRHIGHRVGSVLSVLPRLVAAAGVALAVGAAPPAGSKPAEGMKPAAGQEAAAPEVPKPGPEHAWLPRLEGTWDASVEISIGPPGSAPQRSAGVETTRICCGGLWLVSEFRSNPGHSPFEGHGLLGFDPDKKKYVATWVDSDLTSPMVSEGSYDAASKTLTLRGSKTSRGKTMTWRETDVWTGDDARQFTMYMRGPDGKETPGLKITYTRRK